MRLKQFINEESEFTSNDAIKKIEKDCKPLLRKIRGIKDGKILIRGHRDKFVVPMVKKNRRKDRKPMNTSPELTDFMDDGFEEVFGWRPRKEGVFAVWYSTHNTYYGVPYLFFPIGNFKYITSYSVQDMYIDNSLPIRVSRVTGKPSIIDDESYPNMSPEEVRDNWIRLNYTNKGIKSIRPNHEIMFDCDEYYLVNTEFLDPIYGYFGLKKTVGVRSM